MTIAWAEPRNLMCCSYCERHGFISILLDMFSRDGKHVVRDNLVVTYAREDRSLVMLPLIHSLVESVSASIDCSMLMGINLPKAGMSRNSIVRYPATTLMPGEKDGHGLQG